MEAAARAEQRADDALVATQQGNEETLDHGTSAKAMNTGAIVVAAAGFAGYNTPLPRPRE